MTILTKVISEFMSYDVHHVQRLTVSMPAAYLIRVRGWLDARCSDYFEGLSIVVSATKGMPPESILCGQVADQAALMGILSYLHESRTTLLSVECLF